MSYGKLARYSLWQFRDFWIERGAAILIVGFLWGYALIEPLRLTMKAQLSAPTSPVISLVLQVASAVVSLAVLIALNGMVSGDRKKGYYRFIFDKPVNVMEFYSQLFFVYMAGVLVSMAILGLLLRTVLPGFNIFNYLLYTAVIYIAMGGIGFFLSVTSRYDWLSLAAVWLGSRLLRDAAAHTGDWRGKLAELLPPVHKLDGVANSLISSRTAEMGDVIWLVGYGAAFFVIGLLILNRGSLAD
ncbi:MAG TPA: hypothetical protein VGG76_06045 [Gemmatimonadaceae bacterium]